MTLLFLILVILASVILGLIVLIQNPKGGGLAGNIAGFSTQFMGVKQTTDVLEKGTWIFAILIAVLSITSSVFISKTSGGEDKTEKVNPNAAVPNPTPANTTTLPGATPTTPVDSPKK
ncbi:MAG: preprotein translocase subunit SecG [Bacteroidetes bacterium]|nr:preprotein translocase subunit SecG [Bacteroidota bacterium]MBS1608231.1 preprotein translocase subunit SecG [Bacteroidota bacterium]